MFNITFVDQAAKDKQKYYDDLRACFTDNQTAIKEAEDLLAFVDEELSEEISEQERDADIAISEVLKSCISCLRITIPLARAYAVMFLEASPDELGEYIETYAKGTWRPRSGNNIVGGGEIFELMQLFSETNKKKVIRSLSCSVNDKDNLLDALSDNNSEEFCHILKDSCDYSVLAYFMSKVADRYFQTKILEEIITWVKKDFRGEENDEEERRINEMCQGVKAIFGTTTSPTLKEYVGDLERNTILIGSTDLDDDDVQKLIRQIIPPAFNFIFALVAYDYEGASFSPVEESILKPVLESDEYKRLYELNKGLIEQLEEEEQTFQEQDNSTAIDESPKVHGNPMLEDKAEETFTFKLDKNYFHVEEDAMENDHFLSLKGDLKNNIVFEKVIQYLYDIAVISQEDVPSLVYRFTGRKRPQELKQVFWNQRKGEADLCYLVKYMTDDKSKYGKARKFFEGVSLPEDSDQLKHLPDSASVKFQKALNGICVCFKLGRNVK